MVVIVRGGERTKCTVQGKGVFIEAPNPEKTAIGIRWSAHRAPVVGGDGAQNVG